MKRFEPGRSWAVLLVACALVAACMPGPAHVVGVGRPVDADVVTRMVAERATTMVVQRVRQRMLDDAVRHTFGEVGVTFEDDFAFDQTGGSFEVTLAGASPIVGTFRADPLDPRRAEAEIEVASLAIGMRSLDAEGAQALMIMFLYQEAAADPFTLLLADVESGPGHENGMTATLYFGDDDDDPYVGEVSLTSLIDTATRVAGQFEAIGLMTASGAGPIDAVGTFNVETNVLGSVTLAGR